MSSRKRILGLDLDGTLIDAERRQVELVEYLLSARGERLAAPADFWAKKREGAATVEALVAAGFDSALAADVAGRWREQIEDHVWLRRDEWLPGAREMLVQIRSLGVGIAVLTARGDPRALAEQVGWLRLNGLADIVHVVPPRHAVEEKAGMLSALGAAGFIGDSESDYQAALRAGVPFVAVSTGQRSARFLARAGVPLIAHSLAEAVHRLGMA